MTKFESEAIGVRSGRKKGGLPTQKERKKEMEQFLKTGTHTAQELAKQQTGLPTLPERDPHRPHVFMEFRCGATAFGRILIEVFEDRVPLAARQFINRCRAGANDCFQGSNVHRLVPGLGLFGGLSRGHKDASASIRVNQYLQHTERGTVSISLTGSEFVIALSRALTLNASHQVVGRVHSGHEALEKLSEAMVVDEQPHPRISLAACGLTNAQGDYESLDDSAKKATPQEQARQLQEAALQARSATRDALQDALSHKRKAQDQPPASHGAAVAKRPFLDDGLGDDLSSSEDDT